MKKLALILVFIVSSVAFSQGNQLILTQNNSWSPTSSVVSTYADSQIDTVVYLREAGVSAITFSAQYDDSVKFYVDSGCVVVRVFNGTAVPRVAGDTLYFSNKAFTVDGDPTSETFSNGNAISGTPTFAPYADKYLFIIRYAADGNGTTSPSVTYKVHKVYSR